MSSLLRCVRDRYLQVRKLIALQVYLCMRVLLCRFSAQHLAGFWPVLLSEMVRDVPPPVVAELTAALQTRLFDGLLDELPPDGSDNLHLVFSACKFLDLLLTLQTDDFQM